MSIARNGIGFDVHRFRRGRRLILGGVEIPGGPGLDGHSDADVLCHAIADALLGAAADGDIGVHFPNTDKRWKDSDSIDLLRRVAVRLKARKLRPVHVDAAVVAEAPKLAPYRDAMRRRIGKAIGLGAENVSIKATTAERMGAIGRREGIAVMAVATVVAVGRQRKG